MKLFLKRTLKKVALMILALLVWTIWQHAILTKNRPVIVDGNPTPNCNPNSPFCHLPQQP